jgi:hypothetical protein
VKEAPEVAPQYGVEADGGFVEHEHVWSAEQGGGQRDSGLLAAGHGVDDLVGERSQGDRVDCLEHARAGHAQDAREVAQVLARGQVGVDGGCLGDVGDPGAEAGRAGGLPEHLDLPGVDHLGAHDRAHEGGLAAAAGSQQPGDASRQHSRRYPVQHRPAAAHDAQLPNRDRCARIHTR